MMMVNDDKWLFSEKYVRITKSYKYLGMELRPSLRLNEHIK